MPTYECSICGATFGNGDELSDHIRQAHSSVECRMCGQRLSNEGDLVAHISAAHSN